MNERETPRVIPDVEHVIGVETPAGEFVFRIGDVVKGCHAAVALGMDPAMAGALFGLYWYHETMDLETMAPKDTARASVAAWQEYGDGVMQEALSAGLGEEAFLAIGTLLREEWQARTSVNAEAMAAANFIKVTRGARRSRSSTSRSATSVVAIASGS